MVSTTMVNSEAIVVEEDTIEVVSMVVLAYLMRTYASIGGVSP